MNDSIRNAQTDPAYMGLIAMQDEALCHLFFHCCLRDSRFTDAELNAISARFVSFGLHKNLNFKDEILKYRSYNQAIADERAFVHYLIELIKPANELALYSYCLELCLVDADLSIKEEKLLEVIAAELSVDSNAQSTIKTLMAQRKVVESQKLF